MNFSKTPFVVIVPLISSEKVSAYLQLKKKKKSSNTNHCKTNKFFTSFESKNLLISSMLNNNYYRRLKLQTQCLHMNSNALPLVRLALYVSGLVTEKYLSKLINSRLSTEALLAR